MKQVRSILATIAVVLAIGASYASTFATQALSKQEVNQIQGDLIPETCVEVSVSKSCDATSGEFCDFSESTKFFRYFKNSNCTSPLLRPA